MQASPSSTPERFRSLVGLGLAGLLALLVVAGYRSFRDLQLATSREESLRQSVEATESRIKALELRVEQLRSEPEALESVARGDLGMIRPGDVVIVLGPEREAEPTASDDG